MSDDRFLQQLRRDARPLQFQPDDAMTARIAARVRERVRSETSPGVYQFLAAWLRPMAASFAALALTGGISLAVMARNETPSLDASGQVEIAMAGEQFGVGH